MQNDHISQQLDKKVLELEREIEHELEQKKEQKTQQQCFKKWDVPCYPPGHSLWPQDNLPARQYLNKPDGSCGPGYASLAPVHGHHIYQPLWQQPPPLKQQLTYSLSLYLMRYPTHPSTIAVEPATIGIHSNFLPLTHLPMAHKQAMATTNTNGSSFPLLWSCLLHLGSIHLLRSVIQHLVRTLVFQTEI